MKNFRRIAVALIVLCSFPLHAQEENEADLPFDLGPVLQMIGKNATATEMLLRSAEAANVASVTRCVRAKNNALKGLAKRTAALASNGADVRKQMVDGVKAVGRSSEILSAARRCFALDDETDIGNIGVVLGSGIVVSPISSAFVPGRSVQ